LDWLFADGPQPLLGVAGGAAAAVLAAVGLALRHRGARHAGTVLALFMADVSGVLFALAIAVGVVSAALTLGVEGPGSPIWLLVAVLGAVAALALLGWRWRTSLAGVVRGRRTTPTGTPARDISSTAWEIGVLVGGGAALLTYLVTADHGFGHPPHWILAGLGGLVGYAVGIAAATPRFRFVASRGRR